MHVVLPSDVTEKVDAYAAELQRVNPGSRVTRSEVVRRAVYQFLNLEG